MDFALKEYLVRTCAPLSDCCPRQHSKVGYSTLVTPLPSMFPKVIIAPAGDTRAAPDRHDSRIQPMSVPHHHVHTFTRQPSLQPVGDPCPRRPDPVSPVLLTVAAVHSWGAAQGPNTHHAVPIQQRYTNSNAISVTVDLDRSDRLYFSNPRGLCLRRIKVELSLS